MIGALVLLAAATIPLRNPFWPVGYRGTPEPIDDEPHIRVAVENLLSSDEDTKTSASVEALAAAARDANGSQEMERRWIRARKSLRIGGMMKSAGEKNRQSIAINGYIYGDGSSRAGGARTPTSSSTSRSTTTSPSRRTRRSRAPSSRSGSRRTRRPSRATSSA